MSPLSVEVCEWFTLLFCLKDMCNYSIQCSFDEVLSLKSSRDDGADVDEKITFLCNNDDIKEEIERISYICSCIIDAIKSGGSVLIPIGRLGVILLLLELISEMLHSSSIKVTVFLAII